MDSTPIPWGFSENINKANPLYSSVDLYESRAAILMALHSADLKSFDDLSVLEGWWQAIRGSCIGCRAKGSTRWEISIYTSVCPVGLRL